MARGPAGAGAERRPWPRRLRAGESAGPRRVAGAARQRPDPQRLSEYHPGRPEPPFPGNLAVEERIARINRWNALAMVVRANQAHGELGGHIASYASAADLFEVGFNHFFRAQGPDGPGDRLHATALRAGRLCARLPGRLPERRGPGAFPPGDHGAGARPARPVVLSAPVADAGLLAVSHRLDGNRPDQRHLSGPLHALRNTARWPLPASARSGASSATARWTSPNRSPR